MGKRNVAGAGRGPADQPGHIVAWQNRIALIIAIHERSVEIFIRIIAYVAAGRQKAAPDDDIAARDIGDARVVVRT